VSLIVLFVGIVIGCIIGYLILENKMLKDVREKIEERVKEE
jgi:hypothetical protein